VGGGLFKAQVGVPTVLLEVEGVKGGKSIRHRRQKGLRVKTRQFSGETFFQVDTKEVKKRVIYQREKSAPQCRGVVGLLTAESLGEIGGDNIALKHDLGGRTFAYGTRN